MYKILHTENSCGWGGQELRTLTEMEGMIRRGHDVTLVCPQRALIYQASLDRGIPTIALPIERKNFRGLFALRDFLKAHPGFDVLNSHSSTDSWLSALACKTITGAPTLIRTRHVSTPVSNNWTTRWLYGSATTHTITTGEALRSQLHTDNGIAMERMTSIATGIDLDRFKPMDRSEARKQLGLPTQPHYLGILATLRNWKGHTYLLDAYDQLRDEFPQWHLLIVGDGPQADNLKRRIKELKLEDRITMPGNRDDVPLWLNAMDLFTLPSYGNEGVPQGIMQAMACGNAVISTPVGAIREAVVHGETGTIVPTRDSEALAAALRELMSKETLRQQYSAASLERATARFGIDNMLDKVEAVYKTVLGR